jgi:hypothetical protein
VETIHKIWKESEGNLRKILELSYEAIEKGIQEQAKILHPKLIEK